MDDQEKGFGIAAWVYVLHRDGIVTPEQALMGLWLVHAKEEPWPVGMAMVTGIFNRRRQQWMHSANVYVAESWRCQGIGYRLLLSLHEHFPTATMHHKQPFASVLKRLGVPDSWTEFNKVIAEHGPYPQDMSDEEDAIIRAAREWWGLPPFHETVL